MKYNKPITLLLLFFILLVTGCTDKQVKTSTEPVQQDEVKQSEKVKPPEPNIKPSFLTKTFKTPFLSFDYPADWDEDRTVFSDNTITSLVNLREIDGKEYTGKRIDLNVSEFDNISNVKTIDDFKQYFFENKFSQIDHKLIDDVGYLNDDIAIVEYINYEQSPFLRNKHYIWTNNNGKFYFVSFCLDESNANNEKTKEMFNVFEESLNFK